MRIKEKKALLAAAILVGGAVVANLWFFVRHYGPDRGTGRPAVPAAQALGLTIATDRRSYRAGEPVRIIIANSSARPVREQPDEAATVRSDHDPGMNYGVGMIERLEGGAWLAVEPVWRCEVPCNAACPEERSIAPSGQSEYLWDRSYAVCGRDGAKTVHPAPPGRYRVTAAVRSDGPDGHRTVHSPEFMIQ